MGQKVTAAVSGKKPTKAAEDKKEEVNHTLQALLTALQNKLDVFLAKVELARGESGASKTEVSGGRTVMRHSAIRIATGDKIDDQIEAGLNSFFNAAEGLAEDNKASAKESAIQGAKTLLNAGLDALFGVSEGQSSEIQNFVVLFLNNAFVRVDYYMYSYVATGKKFGMENHESGMCYLTDMTVLKPEELKPEEITFFLDQAFHASGENDLEHLSQLKIKLVEQSMLARLLKKGVNNIQDYKKLVDDYKETEQAVSKSFHSLQPAIKKPEQAAEPVPAVN